MSERTTGTKPPAGGKEEVLCHYPGCKRTADSESGFLEVCREHRTVMDAASEVEAWSLSLGVLKPWVETTEAIGFDKLTKVMERALAEAKAEAAHARDELERAEKAAL